MLNAAEMSRFHRTQHRSQAGRHRGCQSGIQLAVKTPQLPTLDTPERLVASKDDALAGPGLLELSAVTLAAELRGVVFLDGDDSGRDNTRRQSVLLRVLALGIDEPVEGFLELESGEVRVRRFRYFERGRIHLPVRGGGGSAHAGAKSSVAESNNRRSCAAEGPRPPSAGGS